MYWFFNKQKIVEAAQKEIMDLWQKTDQKHEERKIEIKHIELKMKLGKLVIYISNEIENVKVGIAKDIVFISKAELPYLVVKDIITNEEVIPMGTIFDYSEQKFNAFNKLEPNERIAIIYNKLGYHHVDKSSSQTTKPEDANSWAKKINSAVEKWKEQNKNIWEEMISN